MRTSPVVDVSIDSFLLLPELGQEVHATPHGPWCLVWVLAALTWVGGWERGGQLAPRFPSCLLDTPTHTPSTASGAVFGV